MKRTAFIVSMGVLFFGQPVLAQDRAASLTDIDHQLAAGQTSVNSVLTNPTLLPLHSETTFRELVKQHARPGKLTLVSADEPGTRITVKGVLTDASGAPQANQLVYVYQTSAKGWYADTATHISGNEGDRRHARLFGYLKTDVKGAFEIETVLPGSYPGSALPAHIHLETSPDKDRSLITELLFDEDPKLTGPTRERSLREGFLIARNSGTEAKPVYFYTVRVR